MDKGQKGSNSCLTCNVCKINFNSTADYALHEFSKKHCDNLIKVAHQKPVNSRSKTETGLKEKQEPEAKEKEKQIVTSNSFQQVGSFAKYGYFVPGQMYASAEKPKEFNLEYDPYLQKFAENPFKEKPQLPQACSFSSSKSFKKKKKKTCQLCKITLATVPEYQAHLKSVQHMAKLKVTGMGVAAHFVKASSDLHTTDDSNSEAATNSAAFPLTFCSQCKIQFDSPQQYNSHLFEKSHVDNSQKETSQLEEPVQTNANKFYCYSCSLSVHSIVQYNEHKNGKKHRSKCVALIKNGIAIPPEEVVPGLPAYNINRPIVYPELYQKQVTDKQNLIFESPRNDCLTKVESLTETNVNNVNGIVKETRTSVNETKEEEHVKTIEEYRSKRKGRERERGRGRGGRYFPYSIQPQTQNNFSNFYYPNGEVGQCGDYFSEQVKDEWSASYKRPCMSQSWTYHPPWPTH